MKKNAVIIALSLMMFVSLVNVGYSSQEIGNTCRSVTDSKGLFTNITQTYPKRIVRHNNSTSSYDYYDLPFYLPDCIDAYCAIDKNGDDTRGLIIVAAYPPKDDKIEVFAYSFREQRATLLDTIRQVKKYEIGNGTVGKGKFFVQYDSSSYYPVVTSIVDYSMIEF